MSASRSRNNTVATKLSDPELSALLRDCAEQEQAGHRRVTKSSLLADIVHQHYIAKGFLTDDGAECPHPRELIDKGLCGVCGATVRS